MRPTLGLFFGSFDPIHIGHLSIIHTALTFDIDSIAIIPAKQNPFKSNSTEYNTRITMCDKAIEGFGDRVFVSKVESTPSLGEGPVHTTNVLKELENIYGDRYKLVIITTVETFNEIPKWYNGEEIISNYEFFIIDHKKWNIKCDIIKPNTRIVVANKLPCSSSYIRHLISLQFNPIPYILPITWETIKRHKLYGYEEFSNNT